MMTPTPSLRGEGSRITGRPRGPSVRREFDYRCPFARNGHESVVAGLRDGRDWDVTFVPFSLDQVHVEEGEPPCGSATPRSGARA